MEKKQRSRAFRILDVAVTVMLILVIAAAVIAGVILAVQYFDTENAENTGKEEKREKEFVSAPIYSETSDSRTLAVGQGTVIGIYFYALSPFSAVDVKNAGGDSLSVSVYAFDTDYGTSVAGEKLAFSSFEDFEAGSWLSSAFPSLPAGEYIAVISSPSIAELFTSYDQSPLTLNKSVIYKNGELLLNCVPYFKVIFDNPPENDLFFG